MHVHASTPCSSGSPLKNFSATIESEADRSWKGIMENVSKYLLLGNSRSFELPRNNNIWKREETKRVLKQCGLQFDAEVFYVKPVCKHQMDCLSVKCLSFVVRQLGFAICSRSVLVGASVRNMQGCMMSTGQQPVCITKNWQRPFWPPFVLEERTPEHVHDFLYVAWNNQNQTNVFLCFDLHVA